MCAILNVPILEEVNFKKNSRASLASRKEALFKRTRDMRISENIFLDLTRKKHSKMLILTFFAHALKLLPCIERSMQLTQK